MLKCTSTTGDWVLEDNKRLGYNVENRDLYADTTEAEGDNDRLDMLSNGFKQRQTSGNSNAAQTYIYLAFAESPFKYSNAR